jgi:uridine kinase
MKIAIIGSRGYPYVYSGYETFVKELSERLVKKNIKVTVYCHDTLYKTKPKVVNGINLKYIRGINTKSIESLFFFNFKCLLL